MAKSQKAYITNGTSGDLVTKSGIVIEPQERKEVPYGDHLGAQKAPVEPPAED